MWWVYSLIALVWLVIEAVAITFFLMVALNGFPFATWFELLSEQRFTDK